MSQTLSLKDTVVARKKYINVFCNICLYIMYAKHRVSMFTVFRARLSANTLHRNYGETDDDDDDNRSLDILCPRGRRLCESREKISINKRTSDDC